jgi:hypothetical protein
LAEKRGFCNFQTLPENSGSFRHIRLVAIDTAFSAKETRFLSHTPKPVIASRNHRLTRSVGQHTMQQKLMMDLEQRLA